MKRPHYRTKRPLDIVMALLAGLFLMPVALPVSIAVKLTSPGPVVFRQLRVGERGREFSLLKFRTMVSGDHMSSTPRNPDGSLRTSAHQDSFTKVGRFLRRWSLDEIPQLINVLKGDMSLIGPRPDLPFQALEYDNRARSRLAVRPGITGLAQISGRNAISFSERRELDLEYVKNCSLRLDLRILIMTLPAVVAGKGVYQEVERFHGIK